MSARENNAQTRHLFGKPYHYVLAATGLSLRPGVSPVDEWEDVIRRLDATPQEISRAIRRMSEWVIA